MIPKDATHFEVTYGALSFWRYAVERYCFEFEPAGEIFYAWYFWDRGTWVKQNGVSARRFQPICQFMRAEHIE